MEFHTQAESNGIQSQLSLQIKSDTQQQNRKKSISFNPNNTVDVDEYDDRISGGGKHGGSNKFSTRDKRKSMDFVIRQPGSTTNTSQKEKQKLSIGGSAALDLPRESILSRSSMKFPMNNETVKSGDGDSAVSIESNKQTVSYLVSTKKGLNIPTKEELLQERLMEIRKRSTMSPEALKIGKNNSSPFSNIVHTATSSLLLSENTKLQSTVDVVSPTFSYVKCEVMSNFDVSLYSIASHISDSSIGKLYKVLDQKDQAFTMLKIVSSSQKELHFLFSYLEFTGKLKLEGILRPEGISAQQIEKNYYILNVLFDSNIASSLDKEINKFPSTKFFQEHEVIEILRQSAATMRDLHGLGIGHGNISPENILITFLDEFPTKPVFILTPPLNDVLKNEVLVLGEGRLLKELLKSNQRFLSPPLYSMLSSNKFHLKHDKFKSDVYSLGMVVLLVMTLNTKALSETRFKYDLSSIKNVILKYARLKYSTKLIDLVSSMLVVEERQRVNAQTVLQKLEAM